MLLRWLNRRRVLWLCILLGSLLLGWGWYVKHDAAERYQTLASPIIYDRTGSIVSVATNAKGHYVIPTTTLPPTLANLLLAKEDQWFYYHPGINPVRTISAFVATRNGDPQGGSTLTQQLAKQLLGHELERTLGNKLHETVYALGLEVAFTKDTLLEMYANSVYLGEQVQGFETASRAYFDTPLSAANEDMYISLLATLSHPSTRNPWAEAHEQHARSLATRLRGTAAFQPPPRTDRYSFTRPAAFELRTLGLTCETTCTTTIDTAVTEDLRAIVQQHIAVTAARGGRHAAVVVLDAQTGEIISLIGSPDPHSDRSGNQLNLAITPRPIGSTVKPLIYLEGFAAGLRPYTTVEDREYRYPIATGYNLYPQNYDGQYRGTVTLHEALSNSLNVPTVKTLEYIGLSDFYNFLQYDLAFTPIAPLDTYQYGIALGGLEMDLLALTSYFTIFPTGGTAHPPRLMTSNHTGTTSVRLPVQNQLTASRMVSDPAYVSLINAILSDRLRGVEQFGLANNLTLPVQNYGVKTGTSRDYHDSWVVGYTSDLVVGVWLGNAENTALAQISGQSGAGAIWHDIMTYLIATPYYSDAPLPQTGITAIPIDGSLEWGLPDDVVSDRRALLQEPTLIRSPHSGDTFAFPDTTAIPLRATQPVTWFVNGRELGTAAETSFRPAHAQRYEIMAVTDTGEREIIWVELTIPSSP